MALGDVLLGTVAGAFLFLHVLHWRVWSDVGQTVPSSMIPDVRLLALTPFDFVVRWAGIGAVIGVLLATARIACRRREWNADTRIGRLRDRLRFYGVVAGSTVLLVAAAVGTYVEVFPWLVSQPAFQGLFRRAVSADVAPLSWWYEFTLSLSVGVGVGAVVSVAMAGYAVRRPASAVATNAAAVSAVVAVVGLLTWQFAHVQAIWLGLVVLGWGLGTAAATVIEKTVGRPV
ncbi:hypothetical protein [Halomicrobium salinisoli]|uniref:hypothetical protein n=1 Tax=Halomicrobium salinisoli TaxID=2878391 RepID=UPI001CF0A9FA|nr:hypothetical protein [Halomicrobium salinisoli]